MTSPSRTDPAPDCPLCARLAAYRAELRAAEPGWFNAPVPSFGDPDARLLIVGLAPGVRGANRTGRPFTGDFAGDLLYSTLARYGFSRGQYGSDPDDGMELVDCMVTNAVRCVPPENKPVAAEINACRPFLTATLDAMPRIRVIVTLGKIAHDSTVRALGGRIRDHPFGHGHASTLDRFTITASYHCSRYNTNTGRLTEAMFHDIFASVRDRLDA